MTWFPRRADRPPLHEVGEHPDYWFSPPTNAPSSPGSAPHSRCSPAVSPSSRSSLLPRLVGAGLAIVMLLALVFVLVEAVQGCR